MYGLCSVYLCLYVCMFMRAYVCMFVCECVCVSVCVCVVCVCVHVTHVYIHVHVCVCEYAYIYMYTCICEGVHLCIYLVCVCVCMLEQIKVEHDYVYSSYIFPLYVLVIHSSPILVHPQVSREPWQCRGVRWWGWLAACVGHGSRAGVLTAEGS